MSSTYKSRLSIRNPRDTVVLLKEDGRSFTLEARVESGKILLFISDPSTPVQEGDVILRKLPSNVEEQYSILEATYYSGGRMTPSHYVLKVRKHSAANNISAVLDIEQQIVEKTRRLEKLKIIQARKGIDTEPHYLIEIEDLEADLEELQKRRR